MDNKNIIELFKNFTGIFFKGNKKNYDPVNIHANKIYFAEDTGELLLNNINYSDKPLYSISGNLNQLDISSSYNTVKEILGEYSNLLNAINLKKIIVGKTNDIENYNILYCYSDGIILTIQYIDFLNANTINEIAINIAGTDYDDIIPINSITSKKINTDININNFVRKVSTTSAGAISISGTNTNPIISLLIDNINKGNVELSITEKGLIGNVNIPLKNIDINTPTSLFIKNEDGTIKGELSLDYDAENKFIRLLGFDKQPISSIDATEFIKDGMINNVQLEENPDGKPIGTYLVITFNTDAGKEPIYLNITKLIGIYTAGQGINISDNTISIKIDTSSERYISSSNDGVKIYGIDEKINNVIPYIINFNLLNKLNENSTEEDIYNALNGTKEFSHDNLYNLLNQLITVPFILAKDNLSNIPISFTSSSEEYVIQYEYYETYFSIKIYQSLGVFKIKTDSFNSFQFTVLGEFIKEINAKTSQTYDNFASIQSSGETNPNKIYIDGETAQPYIYKGGEFVPFNGGNNITPSYIEFESPILYRRYAEITSMTRDGDVLYIGQFGGGYIAFDIETNKIIWNTAALNAGRSQQSLVVKGDYLYTIGDGSKRFQKYNKKDGSLILSITNSDVISYHKMYIFVANDKLYFWSYVTKTIYLVNEDDLSFAAIGKYDGIIESIDFSEYYGIIYTTDNHLIWLDTGLNEISNLDTTEVTNISAQTNRVVRCTNNPDYCLLSANNKYYFVVKSDGTNFNNNFCLNSYEVGELFCASSTEYINSTIFGAICENGIVNGRNGLIYSTATVSVLPFVYKKAFNVKGKVYLCYGYRGLIKIQIV